MRCTKLKNTKPGARVLMTKNVRHLVDVEIVKTAEILINILAQSLMVMQIKERLRPVRISPLRKVRILSLVWV